MSSANNIYHRASFLMLSERISIMRSKTYRLLMQPTWTGVQSIKPMLLFILVKHISYISSIIISIHYADIALALNNSRLSDMAIFHKPFPYLQKPHVTLVFLSVSFHDLSKHFLWHEFKLFISYWCFISNLFSMIFSQIFIVWDVSFDPL